MSTTHQLKSSFNGPKKIANIDEGTSPVASKATRRRSAMKHKETSDCALAIVDSLTLIDCPLLEMDLGDSEEEYYNPNRQLRCMRSGLRWGHHDIILVRK